MENLIEKSNPNIIFNDPIVSYVLDEETDLWGIVSYNFIMYDLEIDPFYVEASIGNELEIKNWVPNTKNKYENISLNAYMLSALQDISFNLESSEYEDYKPEVQEWIKSKIFFRREPDYLQIETTWEEMREVYNHEPF